MPVRVKICGITEAADARDAAEAGADALGFVFAPVSPRHVEPGRVPELCLGVPQAVQRVGLFVDANLEHVRAVTAQAQLTTLQFHGNETPEFCRAFCGAITVWKAFRMRDAATLAELERYRDCVDAFLLDAFVPGQAGGTGMRFDWDLAVQAKSFGKPIILAGGLTPENVAQAVREVRPHAVDVSSGVESRPGRKDPLKVRQFIERAKAA